MLYADLCLAGAVGDVAAVEDAAEAERLFRDAFGLRYLGRAE